MGTILSKQGKQNFEQEVPKFKIVLVGEPAVGKSSIFLRYTKNQFDYSYQPSVSVAIGNVVKKINIPYQGVVSVVIWDVPGREEMDLRKSYYKDVDAAIVVVDVSEPDTIGLAPTWKQDVLNHAQFTVAHNTANESRDAIMASSIPVLLLGNKADKLE
ncbi:rho-related racA-like, partial [Paramuricea clavata]